MFRFVTQELTSQYNYLQLSSKFGAAHAYPGFSSLFVHLSNEDYSTADKLVRFIALRKIQVDRLINKIGIKINSDIQSVMDLRNSLTQAKENNKRSWRELERCHKIAVDKNEFNIQDYLETNQLEHHIKVEKLLSDIENRIDEVRSDQTELIKFMIDEELLETYGDRRTKVW
ncbi:unnamed protein product [Didymodactylos carnosus]|uniref:Ferritin-like diiron domain-containing protein n=1 Tax=Didymodactylos carnosus TaxID=1234261 RepID=A0A813RQ12_9BILA|nr:unnamed protein product [Didymodactylos carnosus]CAF0785472.1 unnamed protein product [Didymodactylos carnosus]CAF3520432.1 unnamed protein product [Didymodactylos carnosus]CAF3569170.1 unnamed protein product [Didymodactylos carnosus]